ncbi:MAG: alpha-ketoglutarate-dependent dioxygenase AlkB [Burkholderiaceae bacterium]
MASADLFGTSTTAPALPRGLRYVDDFLSAEEEQQLIDHVSRVPMHEAQHYQYTAKRRIANFGKGYDFDQRTLHEAPPLPDFLIELRQKVADLLSIAAEDFEQALINEYRPATPLGWHRDALNFELVAGVSLASACRMRFRPYPPQKGRDPRTFVLDVQPRSLYVMQDDARWRWQHSVSPTREQRWSITFRTLRSSSADR